MDLMIANNMDLLCPTSNSNSKDINKAENSNSFSSILEKTKDTDISLNSKDNIKRSKNLSDKKEKVEEDLSKDQVNIANNEAIDEILSMINSIYQMILSLEENTDSFNDIDIQSLNIELEGISNALNQLLTSDKAMDLNNENIELFKELKSILSNEENGFTFVGQEDLTKLKEAFNILNDLYDNILAANNMDLEYDNKKLSNDRNNKEPSVEVSKDEFLLRKDGGKLNNEVPIDYNNESKDESETLDMNTETPVFEILKNGENVQDLDFNMENIQQIDKEDLVNQIVEKINLSLGNDKQEIKVRLKPDILGDLILKMELKDGNLIAKLIVDNYKTKEFIEMNLMQLKEQVKENGLEIKTFEVFVGTNEDFERDEREGFYNNNKKSTKLKIKNDSLKELQVYDGDYSPSSSINYYNSQLNLFA